ncbi:aldo/keto reductase [Streptomyces sp. NPDC020096]
MDSDAIAEDVSVPQVTLNNGVTIPHVGFGLWGFSDSGAEAAVGTVLAAGYRLLDTGDQYRNEAGAGRAVRASGIAREEVVVTTKVHPAEGYDATLREFDASAARFGLDVLDLYLIHWPPADPDRLRGAWRAMEALLAQRRVRAIGVSNFYAQDLGRLLNHASVPPAVNQIELHPWCPQTEQRAMNAEHGIVTEAWGPLGRGRGRPVPGDGARGPALLESPVLGELAAKHGRSPAQVVLRWHLQLGNVVIPKSASPARIAENLDVFSFALDDEDLAAIATLEDGRPVGPVAPPF